MSAFDPKRTLVSAHHSGLMLAARITLPHFSVSSAMSLPKSAGEPASTRLPRSASCALIFRSASAVLISRLSLLMTSVGVFLGEPMPDHPLRLVARHEFADGRDVGQRLRARRGRHSERAQLAGPDVSNRRERGDERDLHLSAE